MSSSCLCVYVCWMCVCVLDVCMCVCVCVCVKHVYVCVYVYQMIKMYANIFESITSCYGSAPSIIWSVAQYLTCMLLSLVLGVGPPDRVKAVHVHAFVLFLCTVHVSLIWLFLLCLGVLLCESHVPFGS